MGQQQSKNQPSSNLSPPVKQQVSFGADGRPNNMTSLQNAGVSPAQPMSLNSPLLTHNQAAAAFQPQRVVQDLGSGGAFGSMPAAQHVNIQTVQPGSLPAHLVAPPAHPQYVIGGGGH